MSAFTEDYLRTLEGRIADLEKKMLAREKGSVRQWEAILATARGFALHCGASENEITEILAPSRDLLMRIHDPEKENAAEDPAVPDEGSSVQ